MPIYEWDFDDGEFQITPTGAKIYTRPGVYDVTFTVSDGIFADTVHKTVRVQGEPDEAFVTNYLGHFQLGRLSDLEPTSSTPIAMFTTYATSSYASIVPGLVVTANSAGAVLRPSQTDRRRRQSRAAEQSGAEQPIEGARVLAAGDRYADGRFPDEAERLPPPEPEPDDMVDEICGRLPPVAGCP